MYRNIRDLREDHDLTQREIAALLYVAQNQYSVYERRQRRIPVDSLIFFADFYHTSVDYLLGRTDVKQPYSAKKKRR
ncbi:helix-turn-helix transcriptional regulator [Clostridium sp. D33t1_170424_F3]|uniref:helix-turn-helix domain-containing protein n=1 Tax=Clostridium sp. D33t1_170424_F3 TaxID=2787099 RepID=UPI0018AB9759|nr:helix-turn-helix transcriptional regulator [Clostridium sp. D33t1_170424_F3]